MAGLVKLNLNNFYIAYYLIKKLLKNDSKTVLTTWSRDSSIVPNFLDRTIYVYSGKKHFPVRITKIFFSNNTLHKFGEFSFTRSFKTHKKIEKKIKKKKK